MCGENLRILQRRCTIAHLRSANKNGYQTLAVDEFYSIIDNP